MRRLGLELGVAYVRYTLGGGFAHEASSDLWG